MKKERPMETCPDCGSFSLVPCETCEGSGKITVKGIEKDCPVCLNGEYRCLMCGTVIVLGRKPTIRVEGRHAHEVREVSIALLRQMNAQQRPRSPWFSGSFYLAVCIVAIIAMLVIGKMLPWYAVPAAIVGSVLIVSVVGAFQLRHDQNLTEANFLKLMALSLRMLPFLRSRKSDVEQPKEG